MKKITISSSFILKRVIALLIILPFIAYGYYRYSAIQNYNQQYHLQGDDSFFSFLSFKVINNTYAVNDQYIYFAGRKTSISRYTFEAINDDYAKDSVYIYYGSWPIKGLTTKPLDQTSFEIIDNKFSKNKDYVFYTDFALKGANPNTFKILTDMFSTDGQYYYYNGKLLDLPIDTQTFEIINPQYSKDKNHVYYHTNYSHSIIENADPSTFRHIINNYYKDRNHVYYHGNYNILIIENADPNTFEYVVNHYSKDKNFVYFDHRKLVDSKVFPSANQVEVINTPNNIINNIYLKDTKHVFHYGRLIKGADPKTFELIIDQDKSGKQYLTSYSKDSKNVYFNGELIVDADPKSFINIYSHYGADNSNAYYKTTKLANADIQLLKEQKGKFKELGYNPENKYIVSDQYVFYYGRAIKNADPNTFKIESNYTKDKNYIYLNHLPLEGADPITFKELYSGFAKDKQHVFFNFKLLENSDSTSFQFINTKLAKDNNQLYLRKGEDQILIFDKTRDLGFDFIKGDDVIYYIRAKENIYKFKPKDIASFKVLNHTYAIDKYHVYYILSDKFSTIEGADPTSFQVINQKLQKDKNHIFRSYKKIYSDGSSHTILKDTNNIDLSNFIQINNFLYKDKEHIYILLGYSTLQLIKEADIATFTYNKDGYAKDKNYIYPITSDGCGIIKKIDIIKGIDTASYTSMEHSPYGKDKYQVYYNYKPLLGSNPNDFIILKDTYKITEYGKDNNHVYFKDKQLKNADPTTFHSIMHGINENLFYGKDNKAIYIHEQKINVDYNSFYFFKDQTFFARDKDNIYLITAPSESTQKNSALRIIDKTTISEELRSKAIFDIFEKILNEKNSKQKITINNIITPLNMIDINTFKIINSNASIAIDKNYAYFYKPDYRKYPTGLCPSDDEDWLDIPVLQNLNQLGW